MIDEQADIVEAVERLLILAEAKQQEINQKNIEANEFFANLLVNEAN